MLCYNIFCFVGKRKKIRKLMSDKKLTSSTREAQKAEKERVERLKQRNKAMLDEDARQGRIILEEDDNEMKLEVT